jgi:hypothetical protein
MAELEREFGRRDAELDLARLEVSLERREAKRDRGDGDHPYRSVPRPWHPDDVFVVHLEPVPVAAHLLEPGELGGRDPVDIALDGSHQLLSRHRRGADSCAVQPV